ncbi:MAG: hypothetical protein L0241_25895, partial [Planctomycetia bacterium]|nr:hypothetical protein [Planctomycetia bacterium]
AVFDRCTLRLSATWTGGFLNHSDRRFGLLNTPTPKGTVQFATTAGPAWANANGKFDTKQTHFTAPLPSDWAKYRGLHLHGDRVIFRYTVGTRLVLESARAIRIGENTFIASDLEIAAGDTDITRFVCDIADGNATTFDVKGLTVIVSGIGQRVRIAWIRHTDGSNINIGTSATLTIPAHDKAVRLTLGVAEIAADDSKAIIESLGKLPDPPELTALAKGGRKRWGEPITTQLERGNEDSAFAVDTLTIPYKNRFHALFFCTGLDFLKDGRIAVCTCHGDVWIVNVDEKVGTCSWQRFATGLYHPLGLKVIDGKVIVLERGQLTRLHDLNSDGEADFYECMNNDWHTGGGEHSYDTCLETDPQGNFYFFKTGDTATLHGGCLMKVSKDGAKSEVFSTGFRHPIGMGMSLDGIITGADQEGNWMPATRLDEYKKGGFYGDMRAHHRKEPPKSFDPPLCWIPREVDNSAGGQVWVPGELAADGAWTKSALAGRPLHFSYGRCQPFVLLRQVCEGGIVQGGVAPLNVRFLSGVCRGRFHPTDGHLYVCGLTGWQTAALADGCLQRVRLTGKPLDVPVAMEVKGNTLRLTFSSPLDANAVSSSKSYRCAWWNYRWSGEYGSKRWKVSDPKAEGQDEVPVRSAKLRADGRTVEITFESLKPVMQMQVGYNIKSADGRAVSGSVYLTIHTTK